LKSFKENFIVLLTGVFITALIASLYILNNDTFRNFEYHLYDEIVSKVEQTEPSGLVSIVDIDEKSLAQFGQWPWPRYKIAQLLEKIQQMGALSVGIDFLFAEPDRTSFKTIVKDLQATFQKEIFSHNLLLEKVPVGLLDNDQHLSKVLRTGPFVLGYSFLFNKGEVVTHAEQTPSLLHPLNALFLYDKTMDNSNWSWYQASDVVQNLDAFSKAVKTSGFFNVSPDHDGIIRKVPLILSYQSQLYPSLSLATLINALQVQQVIIKRADSGIDSLLIDEQQIPIDNKGNVLLHFRNSKDSAFQTISAADILNNKTPKQQLANQIVLLGTSAKGLLDLRSTPYNPVFPGVEIHATLIDNIIRGDFITKPSWSWLGELILMVFAGIVSMLAIIWARAMLSFSLNLLLISFLLVGSWWWLQNDRVYLSVFYPILIIFLNLIILSILQYRFKEIKLIRQTLEHNKSQKIALDKLTQAQFELQLFSDNLEQQVKDRTKELADINQRTRDSIEYASLIQGALIPENKLLEKYFSQYFVIWNPKDIVGGDIYLVEEISEDELLIMVIDCTGHGVPGAFVTMLVKAIESQILAAISENKDINPAAMLGVFHRKIKYLLKQESEESMSNVGFDGGILYYNKNQKLFRYSGANTPLFIIENNELSLIKSDRSSIGYNTSELDLEFKNIEIASNDGLSLYITTDGYLDQTGGEKQFPFGKRRFKKQLEKFNHKTMAEQKEIFLNELLQYQQKIERVDDVTFIGIKV